MRVAHINPLVCALTSIVASNSGVLNWPSYDARIREEIVFARELKLE